MKAGVTVSASKALDEFLASKEEPPGAPREPVSKSKGSKLWDYSIFVATYWYATVRSLSAYWQILPMHWAAVISPQCTVWLSSERGHLTPVDLDLVLAHSALLVLLTALFLSTSCRNNDTMYLWTTAFVAKAMFCATITPLLLGGFVSWLLHAVKMKSERYHVLIRRCLNMTRRTHLQSIGAVSSSPLPPITSVEESVDTLGAFSTVPQLKFIRRCIVSGLSQIRGVIHINAAPLAADISTQSVKTVGNDAHVLLKEELLVYLHHLVTAKYTFSAMERPSLGLGVVLNRVVHPFTVTHRMVVLLTSLYHGQYTLVRALNDLGISTAALNSISNASLHTDSSTDKLFNDLSRIMMAANRLRLCHEWEATRLWNCEFQLNEALTQLCQTDFSDDRHQRMEIFLAKVVAFFNGAPVPAAGDEDSARSVLSLDSDLVSRHYPQKQKWEEINIQLIKVVNEYLVSVGGTTIICSETTTPSGVDEATVEGDVPRLDSPQAIVPDKKRSDLDEYSCGAILDYGPAPNESPDPRVVDIFSGIVTPANEKAVFQEDKELHDSIGSKAAIGLMGELKQHMCARIINSGLLQRENGGKTVPISIQDIALMPQPQNMHPEEEKLSDSACNLTGNIATISMLNTDLSAALKLRNVGNHYTLSCGSSSGDSDGDDTIYNCRGL